MALLTNINNYWKLDETSGNNVDVVAANNTTNTSVTNDSSGKISYCNLYSGSSSYSTIGTYLGTLWDNNYTVAVWIKLTTLDSTNGNTLLWPGDRNQQHIVNSSGKLEITCFNGGAASVVGNTTLSTGTWYHVVFQRTGATTGKVFLNGSDDTSGTATMQSPTNTLAHSFRLGSRQDFTAADYDGRIDEVGIWSTALSSGDISLLYNSGTGLQYPFGTAYSLLLAVGTFTLTGISALFTIALKLLATVQTYTLTGVAATFSYGKGILMETGSFILTGFDATFRTSGWINGSKSGTATMVNTSRTASTFTQTAKSSSTWINRGKNQ